MLDLARIEQCQTHPICTEPARRFIAMTKDSGNIGVINRTVNTQAMLKATIALVTGSVTAENMRLGLINDNMEEPGHAVLLVLGKSG